MNNVITTDPTIVDAQPENNTITFETSDGTEITLSPATVVNGEDDHYFEGRVAELNRDTNNIGTDHYWFTFKDVVFIDNGEKTTVDRHHLPLGEVAAQIHKGSLTVTTTDD